MMLKPGQKFDIAVAEKLFPNRRLISRHGTGPWQTDLYYLDDHGVYIEKGPIGTHDGLGYQVCEFNDEAGVQDWIKRVKEFWGS